MRLDHLLSKEQLAGESRPVARGPRMSGRGARMAETLASSYIGNGQRSEYTPLVGGGKRREWCGWWRMMSTLLSPERTTSWLFLVADDAPEHGVVGLSPGTASTTNRLSDDGVWCCRMGLWVGRWLRITQWTRASLWSSCQGRTVDALAPGADEGRGRPR